MTGKFLSHDKAVPCDSLFFCVASGKNEVINLEDVLCP